MAVDNATVHRIIQEALDKAGGITVPERVASALGRIVNRRDGSAVEAADFNWAAADHYLEARSWINTYSPAFRAPATLIILGYDVQKISGEPERTGRFPPTPFNPMVTLWALTGIEDGYLDWVYRLGRGRPRLHAPVCPYPSLIGIGPLSSVVLNPTSPATR
jgi:hypothetical protein